MKRTLIYILIIVLLGAAYIWFFVYNKKHKDIEASKPDFVTLSTTLAEEFLANKDSANAKYSNKVLELKGTISEIIKDDSLSSIVIKGNDSYSITLEVLPEYNQQAINLAVPNEVTLKALYVGFMEADADMGLSGDIKLKKASIQ